MLNTIDYISMGPIFGLGEYFLDAIKTVSYHPLTTGFLVSKQIKFLFRIRKHFRFYTRKYSYSHLLASIISAQKIMSKPNSLIKIFYRCKSYILQFKINYFLTYPNYQLNSPI